jgi:hypothetical protein
MVGWRIHRGHEGSEFVMCPDCERRYAFARRFRPSLEQAAEPRRFTALPR